MRKRRTLIGHRPRHAESVAGRTVTPVSSKRRSTIATTGFSPRGPVNREAVTPPLEEDVSVSYAETKRQRHSFVGSETSPNSPTNNDCESSKLNKTMEVDMDMYYSDDSNKDATLNPEEMLSYLKKNEMNFKDDIDSEDIFDSDDHVSANCTIDINPPSPLTSTPPNADKATPLKSCLSAKRTRNNTRSIKRFCFGKNMTAEFNSADPANCLTPVQEVIGIFKPKPNTRQSLLRQVQYVEEDFEPTLEEHDSTSNIEPSLQVDPEDEPSFNESKFETKDTAFNSIKESTYVALDFNEAADQDDDNSQLSDTTSSRKNMNSLYESNTSETHASIDARVLLPNSFKKLSSFERTMEQSVEDDSNLSNIEETSPDNDISFEDDSEAEENPSPKPDANDVASMSRESRVSAEVSETGWHREESIYKDAEVKPLTAEKLNAISQRASIFHEPSPSEMKICEVSSYGPSLLCQSSSASIHKETTESVKSAHSEATMDSDGREVSTSLSFLSDDKENRIEFMNSVSEKSLESEALLSARKSAVVVQPDIAHQSEVNLSPPIDASVASESNQLSLSSIISTKYVSNCSTNNTTHVKPNDQTSMTVVHKSIQTPKLDSNDAEVKDGIKPLVFDAPETLTRYNDTIESNELQAVKEVQELSIVVVPTPKRKEKAFKIRELRTMASPWRITRIKNANKTHLRLRYSYHVVDVNLAESSSTVLRAGYWSEDPIDAKKGFELYFKESMVYASFQCFRLFTWKNLVLEHCINEVIQGNVDDSIQDLVSNLAEKTKKLETLMDVVSDRSLVGIGLTAHQFSIEVPSTPTLALQVTMDKVKQLTLTINLHLTSNKPWIFEREFSFDSARTNLLPQDADFVEYNINRKFKEQSETIFQDFDHPSYLAQVLEASLQVIAETCDATTLS